MDVVDVEAMILAVFPKTHLGEMLGFCVTYIKRLIIFKRLDFSEDKVILCVLIDKLKEKKIYKFIDQSTCAE